MSLLPARRHEVSRVEAFSDAVFAFALLTWIYPVFSGFSYFLMGPAHWLYGRVMKRKRQTLIAASK